MGYDLVAASELPNVYFSNPDMDGPACFLVINNIPPHLVIVDQLVYIRSVDKERSCEQRKHI